MRLSLPALAATLLSPLAQAVVLPPDLIDGVYEFSWLPGTEALIGAWTYFDLPSNVNITALQFPGALPLPVVNHDVKCMNYWDPRLENITYTDFTNRDHQYKAMRLLSNFCELYSTVHKDAMVVAVAGDMIWYICNWDNMFNFPSNQQRCARLEMFSADFWMDQGCGTGVRAELSIGLWQKTYGRGNLYGEICEKKDHWSD